MESLSMIKKYHVPLIPTKTVPAGLENETEFRHDFGLFWPKK